MRKSASIKLANAVMAFLAMIMAFGPSLDSAAHVAASAIESGDDSAVLRFLAAFDVIDDPLDHGATGTSEKAPQLIVQMAMPELASANIVTPVFTRIVHASPSQDDVLSRSSPPLDRPPRA